MFTKEWLYQAIEDLEKKKNKEEKPKLKWATNLSSRIIKSVGSSAYCDFCNKYNNWCSCKAEITIILRGFLGNDLSKEVTKYIYFKTEI